MPESEYELKLQKPAYLRVETSDGQHNASIDVFIAWRFIADDACKQPSEDAKWIQIRSWLAQRLNATTEQVAENVARQFHDVVIGIGRRLQDDLKKTADQIACSLLPIQESQADTNTGAAS